MIILHIAPTPFFANRGCHIRIKNEINALQGVDAQLKLLVCTYHHGNSVSGIDTRRIATIPGYTQTSAGYSPFRLIADLLLFGLVLKTVWREKPNLLHCHLHEGVLIGWIVKMLLFWRRLPVLMDMQGSLVGELKAYGTFSRFPFILTGLKWVEAIIYRFADYIICSSPKSLELIIAEFKVPSRKTMLYGDMVPRAFNDPCDAKKLSDILNSIPQGRRVIIYTGSLLPGKGVDDILEILPLLLTKEPGLFFIIAGYPAEQARRDIQEMGLANDCHVPGEIPYDDLSAWLATADVALEPKGDVSGEASGKVLHYMAAGLPVVCYDLPNNRNLLGEYGYYATPGDTRDFARQVQNALAEPDTASLKARNAQRLIDAHFSQDRAGLKLRQLYDNLLSRR